MSAETPGKAALDARTDQVLAAMAEARGRGGEFAVLAGPVAGALVGRLRVQFPGRDKETARLLAAVALELGLAEDALEQRGARSETIAPVLLSVLAYVAGDLNQDGAH